MNREQMKVLAADADMQKRRQAVSDPLRMRMLGLLQESEGMTAKEIADRLGMNPNRLYYHLRLLEDAGVIAVVDSRPVGRMVERVYKNVYAGRYIWDPAKPVEVATYLGACMEYTRLGAEEALFEQARRADAGEPLPVITWGMPSMATTPGEIRAFTEKIDALQREFRERAKAQPTNGADGKDATVTLRCLWLVFEQAPEAAELRPTTSA